MNSSTQTASKPRPASGASNSAVAAGQPGVKRTGIYLLAVAAVLVISLASAIVLKAPSTPTNDAATLAKLASSEEFQKAPPEKQRQYMISMNNKSDQIVAAYKSGKLTPEEYRAAMNAGWMAKQDEHMAKYYALPAGKARADYLDRLADKHEKKKASEAARPELSDDFKHDPVYEEGYVARWPPEKRAQYESFRQALLAHRRAYEEAHGKPRKKSN